MNYTLRKPFFVTKHLYYLTDSDLDQFILSGGSVGPDPGALRDYYGNLPLEKQLLFGWQLLSDFIIRGGLLSLDRIRRSFPAQALGNHAQPLGELSQDLGKLSQRLGKDAQGLRKHAQSLGKHSQTVGKVAQALGEHSQTLGDLSQALGEFAQGVSLLSQGLGKLFSGSLEQDRGLGKQNQLLKRLPSL